MGRILYVGGDDSNHAGDSKGEFILATFSFLPEDSIVQDFEKGRDLRQAKAWLNASQERDYLFTIRTAEQFRHSGENLPAVLPTLIAHYIKQYDEEISSLKVYLDGGLRGGARKHMRNQLTDLCGISNVVVDNFIKRQHKPRKNGERKRGAAYHCPKLVKMADVLANSLYRWDGPVSKILTHEKMVGGTLEQIKASYN